MLRCVVIYFVFLFISKVCCSGVTIENNGYKNILIALPYNVEEEERPRIVRSVEDMLRSSSVLLQMATKGRTYISRVNLLIPHSWKIPEDDPIWKTTSFNSTTYSDPRAALTIDEADVFVTDVGQYPYVLHQGGCGQRGKRIVFPKDFLSGNVDKGVDFLRLWSEYRYGVFPEGGFPNDEKYPATYWSPSEKEEKTTGCSDKTFWSSSLCDEGDKQCKDTSFTSSVMNQHLSSPTLFCEGDVSLGPRHHSESPSKHNLLCKEEGTWFTIMKSPDFYNGRNAAPKYLQRATNVSFRFVREAAVPRVIVAIENSSRMKREKRFVLAQAALYQFVYSTLPYGSEIMLFTFGGEEGVKIAKQPTVLKTEDTRILYIESQPLPRDASDMENASLSELFDEIFQAIEDSNDVRKASPDVIIITNESHLNSSTYDDVKQKFLKTESRLHVMLFPGEKEMLTPLQEYEKPLQDLCKDTGGELMSLHADSLGDLSRGFGKSIGSYNEEILILQDYLKTDNDIDLEIPFIIDESLSENLKISLIFPFLDADQLQYRETILQTPSGNFLNFMKLDFLLAWIVDLTKPDPGEYILKIRRMEDITAPVLVTVTGRPSPSEDPITVNVWTETLVDTDAVPQPVRIYAEVRKGWNPIKGAQVIASVHHPDGETSQVTLLDDGLGDVDITRHDGIYSRYFTNYTTPGYYNVYVKVSRGLNKSEILKGPGGYCCGSFFSAITSYPIGKFLREAGPFTFLVPYTENPLYEDRYPPARVTDLSLDSRYDRICVLRWTAVGDNYDVGFAATYELKMFRDSANIRNRFSGSGQEVYSEMIKATPEAVYGTTLNHVFELPIHLKGGAYYIAIRAVDIEGNAGEASNAVAVFIEQSSKRHINCEKVEENCKNGRCERLPTAAKLQGNVATNIISGVMASVSISATAVVSFLSLAISLFVLVF